MLKEQTVSNPEYIVFGKPYLGEEEIAEVVDSLRKGWLGTGPKVRQFEEDFRAYIGASAAVATHSCTAALFLSQLALGISSQDAVVTTPLSFVATANSITHTGATPLFVDVDAKSGLLEPVAVEAFLNTECRLDSKGLLIHTRTGKTVRALLPVHLWGQPADMAGFRKLADQFSLYLIEDAAHAIEATSGGLKVGTTADVSCFSFYATKNICTGEGGMVTTSRPDVAARVRRLAQHGLDQDAWKRFSAAGYKHYLAIEPGWKFNMMDLQAALGIHQLRRLGKSAEKRLKQWKVYTTDLAGMPGVHLPPEAQYGTHARHLFTLSIDDHPLSRDAWLTRLHEVGVGAGVHYLSITEHPAYEAHKGTMPNAELIGRSTLSIPLGGALSDADQKRVVRELWRISDSSRIV